LRGWAEGKEERDRTLAAAAVVVLSSVSSVRMDEGVVEAEAGLSGLVEAEERLNERRNSGSGHVIEFDW
jgi:hypothetical protein